MTDGKPSVLLIEDNPVTVAVVSVTLESRGYAVETALDGAAVALAADRQPALILLGLKMPGMNGDKVARQLRANPRTADIPIILISGDSHGQQEAARIGAQGYLERPIDPRTLLATVAAYAP
jgi:twitching motility two-component system response regulator PilH